MRSSGTVVCAFAAQAMLGFAASGAYWPCLILLTSLASCSVNSSNVM